MLAAAASGRGQHVRLELNIPAFEVQVVRSDTVVRRFPVAVGMASDPTPVGEFAITEVTWHPWWHPPQRPWAEKDTVLPPGPDNPMGVVKLLIGGLYFLHGTPFETTVGHAASHGCIRMRQTDAVELARLVLRLQPPGATPDADLVEVPAGTVVRPLSEPVPMSVIYATITVAGDSLHLYPDIYGRRGGSALSEALAVLSASGVDTLAVNRTLLSDALRRSARRQVAIPLAALSAYERKSRDGRRD